VTTASGTTKTSLKNCVSCDASERDWTTKTSMKNCASCDDSEGLDDEDVREELREL